jgi:nucleoside-diphosphate-sugar epimerase
MTTVCVTGASGFVGKNLCGYLEKNVFALQQADLRQKLDVGLLANTDVVVHLAGKAHDLQNTSDPHEYFAINFELTKQVFDAFLRSDAARVFIFVSSVKAVRDVVEGALDEEDIPKPATAYGKSKLLAENYLLSNTPADKKIFILRPCMIHGPGNKGNLNLLYKLASKNIPWPLGAFENERSFCSIDNLCFVVEQLIKRTDIPSGIYNVADDVPVSTNQLIGIIAECQKKSPRILRLSRRLIKTIARVGDYFSLPLNTERLQKLTESYVVSNQKLLHAIGTKLPLSSHEGLKKTILSFKNAN